MTYGLSLLRTSFRGCYSACTKSSRLARTSRPLFSPNVDPKVARNSTFQIRFFFSPGFNNVPFEAHGRLRFQVNATTKITLFFFFFLENWKRFVAREEMTVSCETRKALEPDSPINLFRKGIFAIVFWYEKNFQSSFKYLTNYFANRRHFRSSLKTDR